MRQILYLYAGALQRSFFLTFTLTIGDKGYYPYFTYKESTTQIGKQCP